MLDCFTLLQLMAPPPKVNTYPEVDFLESIADWSQYTQRDLGALLCLVILQLPILGFLVLSCASLCGDTPCAHHVFNVLPFPGVLSHLLSFKVRRHAGWEELQGVGLYAPWAPPWAQSVEPH